MHLKVGKNRNKAFLMLSVFLITTLLMGSLSIGYQLVYSKGKKIISSLKRKDLIIERENVENIIYNEFYKIDLGINENRFKNSLEYFAKNQNIKRIWEDRKGELLISDGGYRIKRIMYEDKVIYTFQNGNFYSKMQKILNNDRVKNIFKIELEKKIENEELKLKIVVKICLEYGYRNRTLETPNFEKIEEVVVTKYV